MAKSKILVVDDEQDVTELIEFNLRSAGYEVVSAEDGPTALKKALKLSSRDYPAFDDCIEAMMVAETVEAVKKGKATFYSLL